MSVVKPLIGISAYREVAKWGVWEQSADLLPTHYARAIETAGGVPVLLPPVEPYGEAARAIVARLDGLVISGGPDVSPQRYGETPGEHTTTWRDDRDEWELALLTAADERAVPTLGVCRGMQVMAVHAGGTLDQHVPDLVGSDHHNPGGAAFSATAVRIEPDSKLASVLEPSRGGVSSVVEPSRSDVSKPLIVQCHHHQSVASHPGFEPVAWADDGLLEAMELPGPRFKLGVQWHPEMAADAGLFAALIEAAQL